MKKNIAALLVAFVVINNGCTPEPISISIKELAPQLSISSISPNAHTLIASVSYSTNSLSNINGSDSGQSTPTLPPGLLVDNAQVTVSDGNNNYVLDQQLPGIYSNTSMNLRNGVSYTLRVKDPANNNTIVATTTYRTAIPPINIMPVVTRNPNDTTIQLKMSITNDTPGTDYYLMAYDHINPSSVPSSPNSAKFPVIGINAVKKIEVFSGADAVNNIITKSFIISGIRPTDTLFVHYAKIDKGYYDYLAAYKRTGSLISQITSEPITLPTNIMIGLGYFSVYDAQRTFYKLVDY